MKAKWRMNLAVVALGVLLTSVVWAQPPGGPGGMRGMRDNPKRKLETFVLSVGQLEKTGKAKLSAVQAKKIVTVISPWRKKSAMTDAQASALQTKLSAALTSTQKKEVESLRPRRGERRDGERRGAQRPGGERRGGPGGGGPSGPGGREGRGGSGPNTAQGKEFRQRMEKMRGFFNTYNPFYPAGSYKTVQEMPARMQEGFKRRSNSINAVLTQLSKKAGRS